MIPVSPQKEPEDFKEKVATRGELFLRSTPQPTTWKGREYWRGCLPQLHTLYNKVCAYSAHWIPVDEGAASVDHFIPKSVDPAKAYLWTNFRLASCRMNSRKGVHQDVLDPFKIKDGTFILDFTTLKVLPGANLSFSLKNLAQATIDRLNLNDGVCIEGRTDWLRPYSENEVTIHYLKRVAPFLAYEINRQGLSQKDLRKLFRPLKKTTL